MVFVAGASGFIGSHLVDFLLEKGRKVKCLARSRKACEKLERKGVEVLQGDITEPESLKGSLDSDDFVIHLVGIMEEKGGTTFRKVHVEGTSNLTAEARRAGVRHFFYQSALGADRGSWSDYLRTKAEAEDIVKESGLSWTIFRPSLVIGPWDGFTRKLVDMIKLYPVLPIPGEGKAKFQPIYIGDWLRCIDKVLDDPEGHRSLYEIGGPEHITYRQMTETLAEVMGRSKPSVSVPMGLMKVSTLFLEKILKSPPVTSDQLRLLEQDNIADLAAVERNFGFKPVAFREALGKFIRAE